MALADDLHGIFDALPGGGLETMAGTVVTSPSQVSTDPLTVQLDGSALAVPVKQFRSFPVFPGMRVGLVRIGTDWVVVGAFTNPGAGTGTMRMALGADTPPELKAFGVEVAFLLYVTKKETGVELGYFFIGLTNTLDLGNDEGTLFGSVIYPVAGDPTSATMSQVKTHFQMSWDLDGTGSKFTLFKDHTIQIMSSVPWFYMQTGMTLGHPTLTKTVTFEGAAVNGDTRATLSWDGSIAQPSTCAVLTRPAAQSVANNAATQVVWTAAEYDPASLWNVGAAGVQAPYTGYYAVSGSFTIGSNTTGQRLIGLSLNGVLDAEQRNRIPPAVGTIEMSISADMFFAAAGDVIGITAYQINTTAVALNVTAARMSARLVNRTA